MYALELVKLVFGAAHIQRWNDHARAHNFTEIDKQSHKMVIAYVLARYEEDQGNKVDWLKIIEGGIFEFLHRIVLTDIKPPIFHLLQKKHKATIDSWVVEQLKPLLDTLPTGVTERFIDYLALDTHACFEKQILQASHYLATKWEFKFIYDLNRNLYGIEETKASLEAEIEHYYELSSVRKIVLYKKYGDFIDLVGQLRFQKRWAQIPRVPETSVLGHMLLVAILGYLFTIDFKEPCDKRIINNFYAGLFHDLPEVLTRDIISPVKKSIEGLEEIIKEIESEYMNKKIYPLLPASWHKAIKYYTENEFKTKITNLNGEVEFIKPEQMSQYNEDKYNPLDGEMLKFCDNISAMLEVLVSKQHGITSSQLEKSLDAMMLSFKGRKIGTINLEETGNSLQQNFRI